MKKYLLLLTAVALSACQTTPYSSALYTDPAKLAEQKSCADITNDLQKVNQIIEDSGDSRTEKLMKDTAVSAAKTGVSASGALGNAGAYANIGLNFFTNLYGINKAERKAQALENAYTHHDLLSEAFQIKGCDKTLLKQ